MSFLREVRLSREQVELTYLFRQFCIFCITLIQLRQRLHHLSL